MQLQLALLAALFALVAPSSAEHGRTTAFVVAGAGLAPPRDQKRLLGSKRLKEARLILFNKAAQVCYRYI